MKTEELIKLPIPETDFTLELTDFSAADEEFVDIAEYSDGKILADMQYYKMNLPGAVNKAYVRKRVGDRLLKAQSMLPEGYHLKIWDAWRSYEVQKSLYNSYFDSLMNDERYKSFTAEQLHEKAKQFVSYPDRSKNPSFVHSCGGAVDLTVTDFHGNDLDMGTEFDDFSERAYTLWLEKNESTPAQKENRRLLYNIMLHCGFTNYPYEWWHYDYGDIFYGSITGESVIYGSVFETDGLKIVKNKNE